MIYQNFSIIIIWSTRDQAPDSSEHFVHQRLERREKGETRLKVKWDIREKRAYM
jgi:hypothetical protein